MATIKWVHDTAHMKAGFLNGEEVALSRGDGHSPTDWTIYFRGRIIGEIRQHAAFFDEEVLAKIEQAFPGSTTGRESKLTINDLIPPAPPAPTLYPDNPAWGQF